MNIIRLELKNIHKSLLFWVVCIGSIVFFMLAFFPNMQSESMQQLARAKMEGMDPALLAAFGLDVMPDFTNITEFFGYVFQYITIAIMVFITQKAISLLIREETDGTIEFLYGRPVSRREIFFQKLVSLFISYLMLLIGVSCVSILGYHFFSEKNIIEGIKEIFIMFGGVLYAGMIFLSIGLLISTVIKSDKRSSAATIFVVFGTYMLGIMAVVVEELDFLLYFSPTEWIKAEKILTKGISALEWGIGLSTIIISIISASILYAKKDMRM